MKKRTSRMKSLLKKLRSLAFNAKCNAVLGKVKRLRKKAKK